MMDFLGEIVLRLRRTAKLNLSEEGTHGEIDTNGRVWIGEHPIMKWKWHLYAISTLHKGRVGHLASRQ